MVKEIFRNGKRRKRCLYEVAACALIPPSYPLKNGRVGRRRYSIKRIVEFHRRERLSDEEVALEAGLDTFFVSLTFEDYELAETRQVLGCRAAWKLSFNLTRSSERPRASRRAVSPRRRPDAVDPRGSSRWRAAALELAFIAELQPGQRPGAVACRSVSLSGVVAQE